MGLPDFLKFVTRSAPSALYRLPKNADTRSEPIFEFDYVLVDATNVSQTVGFERVHALLTSPLIAVHKAVIFALDAQRDRAGTDRFHRQAHIMVGDLDVQVQRCCTKLADAYKKKAEQVGASRAHSVPLVLMSGRHVAGEADYKLLDLHRHLVCTALAAGEVRTPRVLFVSEDSDILCGALCGPAPQDVFIATNLRDTLFDIGILQVSHVVTYVALCIDALAAPAPPPEEIESAVESSEPAAAPTPAPVPVAADQQPRGSDAVAPSKPDTEPDVVRRRKPDGPMVATGVRIALDDSSSDDEDTKAPAHTTVIPGPASATPVSMTTAVPAAASAVPPLDDPARPAATMIHDSTVDFVFLFLIVMGNGGNVPPLVRGSTKVDVTSCWQAYCAKKFTQTMGQEEAELGRTLLHADGLNARSAGGGGEEQAVVRINCSFFRAILEALHYADAQSRPPAEEEKGRALAYLSSAVYATLRYVVGCNLTSGSALVESFLDTRPLSDVEVVAPSLSAVLWLLSQDHWRSFTYPLRGLTRKEVVALRDRHSRDDGASGHAVPRHNIPNSGDIGDASSRAGAPATHSGPRSGEQRRLQMDVAAALVAPPSSSSSWAVRGAGSRTYTLASVISGTGANGGISETGNGGRGVTTLTGTRTVPRTTASTPSPTSVDGQLRAIAAAHTKSVGTPPLFAVLLDIWRATEAPALPQFRIIAATAAFLSPVTNTFVDGPLSRGKAWQGATPAPQKTGTTMVYSFELRRMVPVAAASATAGVSSSASGTPRGEDDSSASALAVSAAARPGSSDALRAALGLSFSYDKVPATTEVAAGRGGGASMKLPRQAMDEDDWAEMARLKKVARKEKDRLNKALAQGALAPGTADGPTAGKKHQKEGQKTKAPATAKRAKRPGKKERQRRHLEALASATGATPTGTTPQNE